MWRAGGRRTEALGAGWRTEVLVDRGAASRGVLVLSRSSQLPCVARAESRREEGVRGRTGRRRDGAEHTREQPKADGVGSKTGAGR